MIMRTSASVTVREVASTNDVTAVKKTTTFDEAINTLRVNPNHYKTLKQLRFNDDFNKKAVEAQPLVIEGIIDTYYSHLRDDVNYISIDLLNEVIEMAVERNTAVISIVPKCLVTKNLSEVVKTAMLKDTGVVIKKWFYKLHIDTIDEEFILKCLAKNPKIIDRNHPMLSTGKGLALVESLTKSGKLTVTKTGLFTSIQNQGSKLIRRLSVKQ